MRSPQHSAWPTPPHAFGPSRLALPGHAEKSAATTCPVPPATRMFPTGGEVEPGPATPLDPVATCRLGSGVNVEPWLRTLVHPSRSTSVILAYAGGSHGRIRRERDHGSRTARGVGKCLLGSPAARPFVARCSRHSYGDRLGPTARAEPPSNLGRAAGPETAAFSREGAMRRGGPGGRRRHLRPSTFVPSVPERDANPARDSDSAEPVAEKGASSCRLVRPTPPSQHLHFSPRARPPFFHPFFAVVFGRIVDAGLTALVAGHHLRSLVKFVCPPSWRADTRLRCPAGPAAAMFVILYLSHGFNAQTTTALLGTLVSLALIGVLATLFVDLARIVNLGSEETTFLQISAAQVNLEGLLLGGIIIGSLGVLNDVTATQARCGVLPHGQSHVVRGRSTIRIGIGLDHIASTVDTLVRPTRCLLAPSAAFPLATVRRRISPAPAGRGDRPGLGGKHRAGGFGAHHHRPGHPRRQSSGARTPRGVDPGADVRRSRQATTPRRADDGLRTAR